MASLITLARKYRLRSPGVLRSTCRPISSESSRCSAAMPMSPIRISGKNSTNTSTSLSDRKSLRSADPNSDRRWIPWRLQNSAIGREGRLIGVWAIRWHSITTADGDVVQSGAPHRNIASNDDDLLRFRSVAAKPRGVAGSGATVRVTTQVPVRVSTSVYACPVRWAARPCDRKTGAMLPHGREKYAFTPEA